MKKVILDRLEGNTAVCFDQNRNQLLIECSLLPQGADEGYSLIINDDGSILVDEKDTLLRAQHISALEDELFQ